MFDILRRKKRYGCSVQFCLFLQSLPGNFLLQSWENLCNVGIAFAATGYYQKINQFKMKIAKKWCYSDDIGFFPVQCYLKSLEQHCTEFLSVQCCPKSITTLLNRIFSCENVFWRLLDNIAQGFYICNVVPRLLTL